MNYLESLRHLSVKNRDNIYVTDIRPGFVDTPMAQGDSVFWASSPKKAAIQIYRAIKFKKKIAYITHRWYWLHWIIKLMPSFIYNRI